MGTSIKRYAPPIGTAGLARLFVKGYSLVPAPPPRITEIQVLGSTLTSGRDGCDPIPGYDDADDEAKLDGMLPLLFVVVVVVGAADADADADADAIEFLLLLVLVLAADVASELRSVDVVTSSTLSVADVDGGVMVVVVVVVVDDAEKVFTRSLLPPGRLADTPPVWFCSIVTTIRCRILPLLLMLTLPLKCALPPLATPRRVADVLMPRVQELLT